jgi:Cu/Ag efflux protein CusF
MRRAMGLALAVLLGWSVAVASAAEVSGKVQSIDAGERVVVLDNGTKFWVAEGLPIDKLKEGAVVKASYEERDGKSVITALEVSD